MTFFEVAAKIAFFVPALTFVSWGFWFYVRAVSEFPGEALPPLNGWVEWVINILDVVSLAFLPIFVVSFEQQGTDSALSIADFLVGYGAGRLIIPAIVPPGILTTEPGTWARLGEGLRELFVDKVLAHIPAALLVVILPSVLLRLFGNGAWIEEYLVPLQKLLPPPLPEEVTKLSLPIWFYVLFAGALAVMRFQVSLGLRARALWACFAGTISVLRLDLAYGKRIELASGWLPDIQDLLLLVAGVLIAGIVRTMSRPGARHANAKGMVAVD